MKSPVRLVAVSLFLALAGCASTIPLNYAPSSVLSAGGTVQVVPFRYLPAEKGAVKPNQIRNTAIGNAYFDRNIDVFVRDAVFSELRFVGIKVGSDGNRLSGEIQEFLIDDLGFSVDWTLTVRYVVKDADGNVIYDQVKTTQRKTAKFTNAFGALNETIKLNTEGLIKDPGFINAIN